MVRRQREAVAASLLARKGYEIFCPEYRRLERRRGLITERVAPLFPGYLFCRIVPGVNGGILTTPHVVSFVTRAKVPVDVDVEEIRMLQLAVARRMVEPWPYVQVGQRVEIVSGPFTGCRGLVVRLKNRCRLVLSISLLQRCAAVEVESDAIVPVGETRWHRSESMCQSLH